MEADETLQTGGNGQTLSQHDRANVCWWEDLVVGLMLSIRFVCLLLLVLLIVGSERKREREHLSPGSLFPKVSRRCITDR